MYICRCKYDHHIQESVYLFVQSSQFFLKSAVQGYQVHKEKWVTQINGRSLDSFIFLNKVMLNFIP